MMKMHSIGILELEQLVITPSLERLEMSFSFA